MVVKKITSLGVFALFFSFMPMTGTAKAEIVFEAESFLKNPRAVPVNVKMADFPGIQMAAVEEELIHSGKNQFSQIDFDRPARTARARLNPGRLQPPKPSAEEKALIEEMKEGLTESVPSELSRTILTFPEEGEHLTPSLDRVVSDRLNPNTITTSFGWTKGERGCRLADDASDRDFFNKAAALEELIGRFSGNTDIVSNYCAEECLGQGGNYLPSALKVKKNTQSTTKFSLYAEGDTCHYQLSKSKDQDWQTIKASELTCSCMDR